MFGVGEIAPDFSLPADDGESYSLYQYKSKHIVLYFYPRDNTPGCTAEARDFAMRHAEFVAAGAVIIGVSRDDVKSHAKFKEKFNLPFSLLSDEHMSVCGLYGVLTEKSMFGKKYMGIERTTFLLEKDSLRIAAIWQNVKVTGHVEAVLSSLREIN